MHKHKLTQELAKLYENRPVTTDGHFYNTAPSGCSISVSPHTLPYSLKFLDKLFTQVSLVNGSLALTIDDCDVPKLQVTFDREPIIIGIREQLDNSKKRSYYDDDGIGVTGYRVVKWMDAMATRRLRFSYHRHSNHRYVDISLASEPSHQIERIIQRLKSY